MIIDNFQIFILYFNYQLSIYEVYNIKSRQAEEFINHQEILDTLEYAQANRNNRPLIESLIDKAALCQGLSHREAALLLECDEPELVQRIYHLAREIKRKFYGNRIVMFAPLYRLRSHATPASLVSALHRGWLGAFCRRLAFIELAVLLVVAFA